MRSFRLCLLLAVLGVACRTASPPPRVTAPAPTPIRVAVPVPVATPAPVPTPAPTPTPTPIPLPVRSGADREPPLVRVLLEGVGTPVTVGEPGRVFAVDTPSGRADLRAPLQLVARSGHVEGQVGAYGEPANAAAAQGRLRSAGVAVRTESNGGMTRVFAVGQPGQGREEVMAQVRQAGFPEVGRWSEGGSAELCLSGDGRNVCGAWLRLTPGDDLPVKWGARSYRGAFEVRRRDGRAVVINVLNLESYLRGVVPAELGPRAFPAIEALKAQAVAARTYTVANLGGRSSEGWDLCDSVQCQVYEGVGVEHPLSDRAVAETRGQILTFQGKPAQTFYHSTCGGHTESAAFQFPRAAAPYLEGVPCRVPEELRVGAGQATGPWVDGNERLAFVGESLAGAVGAKAEARELAAVLTGVPVNAGLEGLVGAFGLEEAGVLVRRPGKQLTGEALAELLRLFRLPLAPPAEGGGSRWELAAVVRLGQLTGSIRLVSGRLAGSPSGLRLLSDEGAQVMSVGAGTRTLERRGDRWREASLSVQPGSAAVLWCAGDRCPLLEVEPRVSADEGSSWSSWRREMSFEEIGRRLKLPGVKAVRVVQRGVSGRAVKVLVQHAGGETGMAGLGFRYALELPDSLFVVSKAVVSGSPGLRFVGRGWGHGVGMCQNGAYGLAVGGASHAEILAQYYPGTVLAAFP